ncbi:MAG: chromate efflux transporter [Gemmatimonadetes bacterium]|nr:chromate efflux transporter [Gemmatimonadota bacterium]
MTGNNAPSARRNAPAAIPYADAVKVWTRVGAQSFGGPAGQIAVMHRILVDEKKWVSEHRFLHALNYCMLLPGPEAQQLATYLGWLLHGYKGGLTAGLIFILPGFLSILALSWMYVALGDVPLVVALFYGLKAAVLAVVLDALLRIGGKVLKNPVKIALALSAFVALFFFDAPFPLVVFGAALIGLAGGRFTPGVFSPAGAQPDPDDEADEDSRTIDDILERDPPAHTRASAGRAVRVFLTWGTIWAAPVVLLTALYGGDHVWTVESVFFSKTALVTFGGAYAVLAYIAQEAVAQFGWLEPGEMLDGLGMAETTPGPLIMVVQFVGFLGAFRHADGASPMVSGTIGAIVTTWATFAPCFLWIFLGGPYIEKLRTNRGISAGLAAVTAAVVGVIANLAVWFAVHVLFGEVREMSGIFGARLLFPEWSTVQWVPLVLAAGSFAAIRKWKLPMAVVFGASVALGALYRLSV